MLARQSNVENIPVKGPSSSGNRFVYGSTSPANGAKSFRILCYGDSNTAGWRGDGETLTPYGQELAETLQAAGVSCEVTCCGICGFTSEELVNNMNSPYVKNPKGGPPGEGLAHMLRDAGPFDLVIIMVGTNDIGRFMDTKVSGGFVMRLHKACHTLGIPTVNVAPTTVPYNINHKEITSKARDLRKRLIEIMRTWANRCPQVLLSLDSETLVPKSVPQLWEKDEFHFSIDGSRQLGKQIASQLTRVLGQHGDFAQMSAANSLRNQTPVASPLTSPRRMQPMPQGGGTPVVGVMPINNLKRSRAMVSPVGMYRNCRSATNLVEAFEERWATMCF
jgi:lysophospholipase L1-like esterase